MMFNPNQPNADFSCNFVFEVSKVGMENTESIVQNFCGNLQNFQTELSNSLRKIQENYFLVKCFIELPNGDKNEVDVF